MSDAAISRDCLHHYDNRHIQVRWDFFELCAYDKAQFNNKLNKNGKITKDEPNQECMAKILRILETLTDHEKTKWYMEAKRLEESGLTPPPEPREFPIQLSYSAICSLLYGTYGESTVRNSVAFLLHRSFIKQYQQTKNSIPFYVLKTQNLQKALKDQAERSLSGVEINSQDGEDFQVLKSTAKRLISTPKSPKSTAKPLISKGLGVEINNNNNSNKPNNDNKQKEDSDLSSDKIIPSFSDLSDEDLLVAYQAELQRRNLTSSKQEPSGDTNVPNTPSSTTSTGPIPATPSSVRLLSRDDIPDHSISAPAPSASEKQVEQESRQDGHIVNGTTKDEEKNVGDVAIREEVTASLTDFDMSANNMQHIKPKIKGNTSSKKKQKEQLTLQGQHIIDLYQAYKKRKVTLNDTNIKAANGLGDVLESDEDFNEVLTVIANDKFIKDKGVRVDLDFVYRKYDGYLDVVDRLRQKASEQLAKQNRPVAATPGSQQYVDLIHEVAHAFLEKEPEDVYAAFM